MVLWATIENRGDWVDGFTGDFRGRLPIEGTVPVGNQRVIARLAGAQNLICHLLFPII